MPENRHRCQMLNVKMWPRWFDPVGSLRRGAVRLHEEFLTVIDRAHNYFFLDAGPAKLALVH